MSILHKIPKYSAITYGDYRSPFQYIILVNHKNRKLTSFSYDNDGDGVPSSSILKILRFFSVQCATFHKDDVNAFEADYDKLRHGEPIESILQ